MFSRNSDAKSWRKGFATTKTIVIIDEGNEIVSNLRRGRDNEREERKPFLLERLIVKGALILYKIEKIIVKMNNFIH